MPLIVQFAPASSLLDRFAPNLADLLTAHGVASSFASDELGRIGDVRLAKTTNRSVLGSMNDFAFLAEAHYGHLSDLLALSVRLADTPCSPLYKRHVTPHDELLAKAVSAAPPDSVIDGEER